MANFLPPNPSLEQLRKQAKELRDRVRAGQPKFTQVARESHPRLADGPEDWGRFSLADAQLVVARTRGFASWRRLREHVEMLRRYSRSPQRQGTGDTFLRLACLTYRPAWRAGPGEIAFHGHLDPVNEPAHPQGLALARLLFEAGADPNDERALDNAGRFPHDDAYLPLFLHYGLGRVGNSPWRARLGDHLRNPADMVQDELRYAARLNLIDRIRLLLMTGTDVSAAHDLAVRNGNVEIAELLVTAGAVSKELDPGDQLVAACLRGDVSTVDRLRTADAKRTVDPVIEAVMLDRPHAVRLLVGLGFPVNDGRGSPLHVAALLGNLPLVRLLVELGADPTAETVDDTPGQFAPADKTPLGWAAYNHQEEVVVYLTGSP